jgi:DNA-binding transcriptional MerR regulator
MRDEHLSPTETARRLGVSPKALRLYEERGLVKPLRSSAGWRTYDAGQIASLHQILALRRMGLSLAQIAVLFKAGKVALESVLAAQEDALTRESGRVKRALVLVRMARARLARGETLSVDDLATLTMETTMSNKPTGEEWKEIFDPLIAKHFASETKAALAQRPFDQETITRQWDTLFDEAAVLMAKGDPGSPAALDLARRWKALVEQFTTGSPVLEQGARNVWRDAMANEQAAPRLPASPEMFAFVGKAMANLPKSD